jgi:hypothetical protein
MTVFFTKLAVVPKILEEGNAQSGKNESDHDDNGFLLIAHNKYPLQSLGIIILKRNAGAPIFRQCG